MEHTNQKKENKKKWLLVVSLLLICAFIITLSVLAATGTPDNTPETTQITEPVSYTHLDVYKRQSLM